MLLFLKTPESLHQLANIAVALSVVSWSVFTGIVKSLLDRFQVGGSVSLVGDDKPESRTTKVLGGIKQDVFEYSLPKSSTALAIKHSWSNDR